MSYHQAKKQLAEEHMQTAHMYAQTDNPARFATPLEIAKAQLYATLAVAEATLALTEDA